MIYKHFFIKKSALTKKQEEYLISVVKKSYKFTSGISRKPCEWLSMGSDLTLWRHYGGGISLKYKKQEVTICTKVMSKILEVLTNDKT